MFLEQYRVLDTPHNYNLLVIKPRQLLFLTGCSTYYSALQEKSGLKDTL